MAVLVQAVLGEVIGETETVPKEEVLVVSKVVGVDDESLVWVTVSVVDTGTVGDVGVDVEGGLVVVEVGTVVVFEEVDTPVRTVTLWTDGTVHLTCCRAQPASPTTEREQLTQEAMRRCQSLISTHQDSTSPCTLCDCHATHWTCDSARLATLQGLLCHAQTQSGPLPYTSPGLMQPRLPWESFPHRVPSVLGDKVYAEDAEVALSEESLSTERQ